MDNEKILDISWKTIFKFAVAFICLYALYLIRDLLVWFLFALIISILFNPVIEFFQRRGVPRILSVVFIYFTVFTGFSFFIYFSAPLFITEIQEFSQYLPSYLERISLPLQGLGFELFENAESFTSGLSEVLTKMSGNIFQALFSLFGGIFSTLFVILAAIFLSLEEKVVERFLRLFVPREYEDYALSLWGDCQKKVSRWFLSRVVACLFVGAASFVSFYLLNLEYPFSLALIAGVLNFIPYIGPLLTAVLLFLFVGLDSLFKAAFVLVVFGIIQLMENSILTPILLKKFLGLPPALLLLTLAVGGGLWGVWGAILCVPLGGILFEFIRDFLKKKKQRDGAVSL